MFFLYGIVVGMVEFCCSISIVHFLFCWFVSLFFARTKNMLFSQTNGISTSRSALGIFKEVLHFFLL